jgi:hypothetical protein
MPSIKVKCPICPETCTDNKLGKHLLSKAHANDLRKLNEKLKTFLQTLKDNSYSNYKNYPPLFNVSTAETYYICLSCKKSYKNDIDCIGMMSHYTKSPKCKEEGIKQLEAFLFPIAKVKAGNELLVEELKKKDKELMANKKEILSTKMRFDLADIKADKYLNLIAKMCGSEFDIYDEDHIKKLENYLNESSMNEGNYSMVKFTQDE